MMAIAVPYDIAQTFVGEVIERTGKGKDHPLIQYSLSLCGLGMDQPDEVPWCSAWLNLVCKICRVTRSRSAAARSWLLVGKPVTIAEALKPTDPGGGFDVVVLKRGGGSQPGPEVTSGAPGHVGLFASYDAATNTVEVQAGNQGNSVSIQRFSGGLVLGVRRLS